MARRGGKGFDEVTRLTSRSLSCLRMPLPAGFPEQKGVRLSLVGWRGGRRGGRRLQFGHTQAAGGPSHVEAHFVAFVNQADTGEIAAQWRTYHLDVRKLEANFSTALGTYQAPAAITVEPHNRSLVEVTGEALTVEIVTHSGCLSPAYPSAEQDENGGGFSRDSTVVHKGSAVRNRMKRPRNSPTRTDITAI